MFPLSVVSRLLVSRMQITSASHRALLTVDGKPAHKLSSVLQRMIPHKSFLEVRSPDKAV